MPWFGWIWLAFVLVGLVLGVSGKVSWKGVAVWEGIAFLPFLLVGLLLVALLRSGGGARYGNDSDVNIYYHNVDKEERARQARSNSVRDFYIPRVPKDFYVPRRRWW